MCVLTVILAGGFATGCINTTKELTVEQDGSGTIVDTSYLSAAAVAMMKSMGKQAGGKGAKLLDEKKFKAQAQAMGVKYVSSEEVTGENGEKGAQVTYAFDDINQVKLFPGDAPQGPDAAEKACTFAFEQGSPCRLTIRTPAPDMSGGNMPQSEEQVKQQLPMMKQMMKGAKIWVRLRVKGTISKTNATHVNEKKDGLTLMWVDFDKLTEDADKFAQLTQIKDRTKAAEAVKTAPGITMETAETVTVAFE
jgi:hypothetical protein